MSITFAQAVEQDIARRIIQAKEDLKRSWLGWPERSRRKYYEGPQMQAARDTKCQSYGKK